MVKRETEWERRKRRDLERADLIERFGNRCMICGRPPKTQSLHIDHDHKTGETRGILCHSCNRRLWTGATPLWLLMALAYLLTDKDGKTMLPPLYQSYVVILRDHLERSETP